MSQATVSGMIVAAAVALLICVAPARAGDLPAASSRPAASQSAAVGETPSYVVLWAGGTRIPSIDITTKGTLLAFAQRGGGDNHPNHVEARRSTDNGKTWSDAQDLLQGWKTKISCANPSSIVDRSNGNIWVFWTVREQTPPDAHLESKGVHFCRSTDDGVTWSQATPLLVDGKSLPGLTTTCRGIQLATGRLLLPYTTGHSDGKVNVPRTIYSDDHGKNWRLGMEPNSPAPWRGVGSSEYTVLELADGRVYMNHRYSSRDKCRAIAYSSDGGVSWSDPVQDKGLPQPGLGCHSGLIRLSDARTDDKSRILFSSPWKGPDGQWATSYLSRKNLTVQISYDECKTWKPLKTVHADADGETSYSNLIVLPDRSIGCIYELNDLEHKIWQRIMFCRVTLDWLTDGADKIVTKPTSQPD